MVTGLVVVTELGSYLSDGMPSFEQPVALAIVAILRMIGAMEEGLRNEVLGMT